MDFHCYEDMRGLQYTLQHHPEIESIKVVNLRPRNLLEQMLSLVSLKSRSTLELIISMANLKEITLSGNSNLGFETINLTLKYPKKIQVLKLSGFSDLNYAGLDRLLEVCGTNSLLSLSLLNFRSVGLTVILQNLQELSLAQCQVNNKEIQQILRSCGSNMKFLDLSGTRITEQGLISVLKTCQHSLRSLYLRYCSNITGVGLSGLQDSFVHLETLDITGRVSTRIPTRIWQQNSM